MKVTVVIDTEKGTSCNNPKLDQGLVEIARDLCNNRPDYGGGTGKGDSYLDWVTKQDWCSNETINEIIADECENR